VFPACGADDLRQLCGNVLLGCYIDSVGGVSYIGGNIFGDKHIVNTSATADGCCKMCQQYSKVTPHSTACVFYEWDSQSCYGHPGPCCRLKSSVAWAGRGPGPSTATTGSIKPLAPTPAPPTPDLNGTVVFSAGLAGVSNYRIPAIVQTTGNAPALVAFAEARDGGDSSASRIAVRTSADAGATWSAVTFAAGSLNSSASRAACAKDNFTNCRVGNPAAVFDAASGGVVLAYVVRGFGGGVNPEDAIGNGISRSADGKTWGKPTDVSAGFAGPRLNPRPVAVMPGPGTALLLESGPKRGRLLVASHDPYGYNYATVTVSDDSGATWRTINQTFPRMDESALTQLPNGSVMINMRRSPQLHPAGRGVAVSNDGGDTFGPISFDSRLKTPICEGSIVSFGGATYFSNPASTSGRNQLTIRKSTDNTATWAKSLLVEEGNSAGYSCLVQGAIRGGDGKASSTDGGLLYEAVGGTIKFVRFPLSL
jgi:sialidase-1